MSNVGFESGDIIRPETYEKAWAGLRMIRETVETLAPPGILPSEDAVLEFYGPEPVPEAEAISDALRKLFEAKQRHGTT